MIRRVPLYFVNQNSKNALRFQIYPSCNRKSKADLFCWGGSFWLHNIVFPSWGCRSPNTLLRTSRLHRNTDCSFSNYSCQHSKLARERAASGPGQGALGRARTSGPREIGRTSDSNLLLPQHLFASCILANNIYITHTYMVERKVKQEMYEGGKNRNGLWVSKSSDLGDAASSIHPSVQHLPTDHLFYTSYKLDAGDSLVNVNWFLSLKSTQWVEKTTI